MTVRTTLPKTRKAKIAIIDDHPIVRAGLATLIARDPQFEVCGEADDVAAGLALIEQASPDVAIVDLALRNGSGLDLIRRIKAGKHPVRILVASMYDEGLFAERAVRAGAAGYINKQEAGRSIVAALHALLSGKTFLSETLSSRILNQAMSGRAPADESPIGQLSDRELEVFTMIGNGATPAEIASKLDVSIKTVDTYRQRIKDKLSLKSSAELSREAMHWALENVK
ncbi:MAG: response regulator transcription factor [Planctomycetia bacterium]|nr:response regulator transcription factor [Planctomycetia bacterium]